MPGSNDFTSYSCGQNVHPSEKDDDTTRAQGRTLTVIFVGRLGAWHPAPGSTSVQG